MISPTFGSRTVIDRPLAVVNAVNTTPVIWYVHVDHLNRPIRMTDATKAVVWNAQWLPWGNVYAVTGTAVLDARFPGQWFQLESGLHYNWYRHYDPTIGRFTQPDPLGFVDGPSQYAYGRSSPARFTDFDGRVLGGAGWAAPGSTVGFTWWDRFRRPGSGSCTEADPSGRSKKEASGSTDSSNGSALAPIACQGDDCKLGISKIPYGVGGGGGSWVPTWRWPWRTPELPTGITGSGARQGSGNRIVSDPPPGKGSQETFEQLGGNPNYVTRMPDGQLVAPNGVRLRDGSKPGEGPRIDIPAVGGRPHETIHFPPGG